MQCPPEPRDVSAVDPRSLNYEDVSALPVPLAKMADRILAGTLNLIDTTTIDATSGVVPVSAAGQLAEPVARLLDTAGTALGETGHCCGRGVMTCLGGESAPKPSEMPLLQRSRPRDGLSHLGR
jgi:hypothetical protein